MIAFLGKITNLFFLHNNTINLLIRYSVSLTKFLCFLFVETFSNSLKEMGLCLIEAISFTAVSRFFLTKGHSDQFFFH